MTTLDDNGRAAGGGYFHIMHRFDGRVDFVKRRMIKVDRSAWLEGEYDMTSESN